MHWKQNRNDQKINKKILTTADLSNVLRTINQKQNQTNTWKNKSSKLNMSKSPITTMTKNNNLVTQADIQRLFCHSNEKKNVKTEMSQKGETNEKAKDFLTNLKFLRLEDQYDKFLSGLEKKTELLSTLKLIQTNTKQKDLTKQFKEEYLVGKIIGQGAYATVRIAIFKPKNKKIAIKVYEKQRIKQIQRKKSIRRQIQILQMLNHPNIVKLYNVVETNNHLNLIMEYLPGVSLNSYLKNQQKQKIAEPTCRKIVKSLAKALEYIHCRRIAHRDIKLQNVILDSELNPKLIDFGFSTCIETNKKLKIFCGTPSYMAPQIVQKKQFRGENADIWALGVLFYVIFIGFFPFRGATDEELHKKINKADYIKTDTLSHKEAYDLISKMLTVDPQKRITAKEILSHPWIQNINQYNWTQKVPKKKSISNERKKRTVTVSSHKSKDQIRVTKQKRRLTQTCKQNLKLQFHFLKNEQNQSKKNTCTNRKFEKDVLKLLGNDENKLEEGKIKKGKRGQKMMDILRMEVKKKDVEKSKSNNKKL